MCIRDSSNTISPEHTSDNCCEERKAVEEEMCIRDSSNLVVIIITCFAYKSKIKFTKF